MTCESTARAGMRSCTTARSRARRRTALGNASLSRASRRARSRRRTCVATRATCTSSTRSTHTRRHQSVPQSTRIGARDASRHLEGGFTGGGRAWPPGACGRAMATAERPLSAHLADTQRGGQDPLEYREPDTNERDMACLDTRCRLSKLYICIAQLLRAAWRVLACGAPHRVARVCVHGAEAGRMPVGNAWGRDQAMRLVRVAHLTC